MDNRQEERNALGDKIAALLKNYRLAHTEDDEGYGYPLVDAVTPPNQSVITLGIEELENLAGEIAWLVIPSETPKKNEPASSDWRDVYRWMQEQGVRFEFNGELYKWFSADDGCNFAYSPCQYRIDLSQTPPDNWREIYKTAQEFGVKFLRQGNFSTCRFNSIFDDYQLAAAKREEPKPKTQQVKMLAWFADGCLFWGTKDQLWKSHWKRVPSEDKIIEVEE